MKIGLIAMSGVRAWSAELNAAGLTMPGVMERGQVIASMPSLSLLTLAGLTPHEHDITYHEIRDLRAEGLAWLDTHRFDLVAISSMTAQIKDAYTVPDALRAKGTRVVLGGLHVTVLPDEALAHADAVVIGEAEPVWPALIAHAGAGVLQRIYRSAHPFNLADAPTPRFDLLDVDKYNRIPLQTVRGCPHACDFCASSILLTRGYSPKPAALIDAELRAIKDIWAQPFIELADDNSFASRAHARAVLDTLRAHDVRWFTGADISIADDPDLLDAMVSAGCRQVLIGLESPNISGLNHLETRRNWKLRQYPRYEAAVRTIQERGITVNGCFILGLDGHDESVFQSVHDFAMRTNLWDVQITVLTPFPGTPLYARLLADGRILQPSAWEKCTLFDVNFVPLGMSPDRLQRGLVELAGVLYAEDAIRARRENYFANLLPGAKGKHRRAHSSLAI
jgi:radical SAM superfamily enzyme YgiQ (UPF0313 family)